MCQGDLGERTVLTPFEECALDELMRGEGGTPAGIYARRAARLADALHEVLKVIRLEEQTGVWRQDVTPKVRAAADQAELILEQESAAAARGEEV